LFTERMDAMMCTYCTLCIQYDSLIYAYISSLYVHVAYVSMSVQLIVLRRTPISFVLAYNVQVAYCQLAKKRT